MKLQAAITSSGFLVTLIMFQLPAAWYQMLQLAHAAQQSQQIQAGFYNITCPTAESIVTSAIRSAHDSDPTVTASLIRLHFHDCFVSVSLSIYFARVLHAFGIPALMQKRFETHS